MKEEIFVIGYPKSGTIWLARLLGDALNSPVRTHDASPSLPDEGYDRDGKYIIRHRHWRPDKVPFDAKTVFTTRDPRDMALSRAHYFNRDLDKAITEMCNRWPGYMEEWLAETRPNLIPTCYEFLLADTRGELTHILSKLGLTPVRFIGDVVERQSLKSRIKMLDDGVKLPYNLPAQRKLLNKGVAGRWRTELSPAQIERMNRRLGSLLEKLGYET